MEKVTKYLDEGEVIHEKLEKFEVFNDEGFLFWAKKYARKQFEGVYLSDVIGQGEDYRRTHLIAEKMLYKNTNTLMVRESCRKVRVADIEDVSKLVGLNIRYTREFLNRLVTSQVLAKRIDTVGNMTAEKWVMNPLYFFCAKRLSPDLYFLFQKSLDCYLSKYAKTEFHRMGNMKSDKAR